MDYKISQFNIVVPVDNSDELILFNSKECSFVVLDKETQNFLADINKINEYDDEVVENLIDLGFIVNIDSDEIEDLVESTQHARLANESLSITIATTLDCNMACPYCFEHKNKKYLTETTADKIIEFILNKLSTNQFKKLLITWTGGEPLLNKDIIKYITEPITKHCIENKIDYHASIITNGLLLTEENAKFLQEMKIRDGQVTLDGFEETNNKRRIALNGYNSFKTILKNINVACTYFAIVIRINIDNNNKYEIKDLLSYLYNDLNYKSNKKISITLAPVSGCDSALTLDDYYKFYRDIYEDYMIDDKVEKFYPVPLSFACGALCKDSYVIGPEGEVYKCWEEIGQKDLTIGTVDNLCDNCERCQQYLKDFWPKECEECSYLPMCHGGCPIKRIDNNNKPICAPQTQAMDIYLKKYYKLWENETEECS
ncbi:radical SAM protein [Clostridium senegalense]|uniref:radical SAM/SPASM domain-containing protein n=1 Tax=Clostridium senegalense TaxID=1465809 RepID=UPI001C11F445|nr:radical SAM protein [Clostridium senegalense]MBU5226374.1 radical SAM protein [Clostridium senegalense]